MFLPMLVVAITFSATLPVSTLVAPLHGDPPLGLSLQMEQGEPLDEPDRGDRQMRLISLQATLGAVSAAAFGVTGFFFGIFGGYSICGNGCFGPGAIIGAALGSGVFAPLGVLGASALLGARGSPLYSLALSLLGAVPSVILALVLLPNNSSTVLGVPFLGMALSTVGAVVGFNLGTSDEDRFSWVPMLRPTDGGLTVGLAGGW